MKRLYKCLAAVLAVILCLAACAAPQGDPTVCPTTVPQTTTTQPTTVPQTQPTTVPQTQPTTVPQPTLPGPAVTEAYRLGCRMPNFTLYSHDGKVLNLYEVLQEKEMVFINIWASWCGPCKYEFPHLQEAYEMYSDRVEVFALSCESTDSPEVITNLAKSMELTFPMGRDSRSLLSKFRINSIPTSIVIDRFGVICFITTGSIPDVDTFARLFEVYLGDDYTESVLLDSLPQASDEE